MLDISRSTERHARASCVLLLLVVLLPAAGCTDTLTWSEPGEGPPDIVGVMKITLSGITTAGEMSASARSVSRAETMGGSDMPFSLGPVEEGAESGIQLDPLSTGSFTVGERGAGGQRYLSATFRVRNASAGGVAYTADATNLTFLAVATASTLEGTAVSQLRLFDGSAGPTSLAAGVLPTGSARLVGGALEANEPDVLQALTEPEADAVAEPAGVTSVFPYGFMVRNINNGGRTLPASPAADQFDGVVTFAFRLPLEATAAADPFEISVMVLAVSDTETRLTQSLEEQTADGRAEFETRTDALAASTVTLLWPDGGFAGAANRRWLCRVRTAGTAAVPTARLVDFGETFQSFSPDPYATDGSASFLPATSSLEATFDRVVSGVGPTNFTVHGLQSGRAFLGEAYTGNGTPTITTPAGSFFPGEVVEVTVTARPTSRCVQIPDTRHVARYRVASDAGPATFSPPTGSPFSAGGGPSSVALGDLNGDGILDLVATISDLDHVSVRLGNGDGTFQAQQTFAVGDGPASVALGDLDGDGALDLATANSSSSNISVRLGNGDGTFQPSQTSLPEFIPFSIAIGDLDGDGRLDLAMANVVDSNVSVKLGRGDGTFGAQQAFATGGQPRAIAIGDLDGDGVLDLVAPNAAVGSTEAVVLLGNGDGTFQAAQTFAAGDRPWSVAIGDLNGDGALDLAVPNGTLDIVSVLQGNGDGTFQSPQSLSVGDTPQSLAIGDLDGDGVLDLAVPNRLGDNVSVLLGNGDGTFQAQQTFATGSLPTSIALGDLDGDGDLDVATANDGSNDVTSLLNQ